MKRKGFAAAAKRQADNKTDHKTNNGKLASTDLASTELTSTEQAEQVAVTILLAGGQQYKVSVLPDDVLLQDLYETLMAVEVQANKRLFQIPINDGQAVLAFPSDRLVGIITEPPLIIEQRAAETPTPQIGQAFAAAQNPLVSNYVQFDQFLSAEEHQQLLEYVIQQQAEFVPTTTFTGENNYRESVVLYSFPKYAELIADRLQTVLPEVLHRLSIAPFTPSEIEAQLTAHNDGQFYKVHNDNGSPDTATRELTYVYYFYREPKPFTGGELVIYDSKLLNNYYVQADTHKVVEPRNNSIVFFLSRYMHEVLPIRCPSGQFSDSRFTINGWIRR